MDQQESRPPSFLMDFDPNHRVLRVRLFGVITNAIMEWADVAARRFLASEGADFGLLDYTAVTDFPVTSEFVRRIAEKPPPVAKLKMKMRIAIAPQEAVYGMNRMYGTLVEQKRADFVVVRSIAEAEALIGLGPLDFSRAI